MNIIQAFYDNSGGKLRILAKVIGVIGVPLVLIGLFLMIAGDPADVTTGVILLIGGLTLQICSWPIYGFGQLIDDVHAIRSK